MTSAKPVGFAIVGTGHIARVHAAAIAAVSGAKLRAVFSRNAATANAIGRDIGVETADSLEAILCRPDVDVVCITTPSGTHQEFAVRSLAAGKHVLCEKPLEISTARIDAMIAAAERVNRILAVVFQMRFGSGAQALKRAMDSRRFGRLALCSAYLKWWRDESYYSSSKWKGTLELDGGGALMNQGIHAVDLLQWLVGLPTQVSAQVRTRTHSIEAEDTVSAVLEYADGAIGVVEAATSCFKGMPLRIEIAGDRGFAVLENDRITQWNFADSQPDDASIRDPDASVFVGGSSNPAAIGIEGHRLIIADLKHAILSGRPPAVSGRDARNAVALIEAIYRSAHSGTSVTVGDCTVTEPTRVQL